MIGYLVEQLQILFDVTLRHVLQVVGQTFKRIDLTKVFLVGRMPLEPL